MVLGFVSLSPGLPGSRSPYGAWEVSDLEELPCDGTGFVQRGGREGLLSPSAQWEEHRGERRELCGKDREL